MGFGGVVMRIRSGAAVSRTLNFAFCFNQVVRALNCISIIYSAVRALTGVIKCKSRSSFRIAN